MDRRQFIQIASATTAATLLSPSASSAQQTLQTKHRLELRAWTANGQPFPKTVLSKLYFLDLQDEPLPNPPRWVEDGILWTAPPHIPFAIALYLSVKGFGNVTLYADNQGRGYQPQDFPLNLNLACARSRIHRVRQAIATWVKAGYRLSPQVSMQLQRSTAKLKRAEKTTEPVQMAAWANESLRESLWAGETAVFEQAQQKIFQNESRPNFLFGCSSWGHPRSEEAYNQAFKDLFNFSTLPIYWRSFEPKPGEANFAQIDRYVHWLQQTNITPKGHPLVWFHEAGVPDWIKGASYKEMRTLTQKRVTGITRHFGARIPFYDIINEAHDIAWSNEFNYSPEQFLDMTRLAAEASAAGYEKVQRIINTCCTWAEYIPKGSTQRRLKSAYQYLKDCISAEIPFEITGLQLYYPNQDMFEINRLLDRFSLLGKPIHITELGVSSATHRDEQSFLKNVTGLWHRPWSESIQADWIEQFYTICYSKPYIQAISWWDLHDGGFWPHGGLLHSDMTPKESFYRLQSLQKQWQQ